MAECINKAFSSPLYLKCLYDGLLKLLFATENLHYIIWINSKILYPWGVFMEEPSEGMLFYIITGSMFAN